MELLTNLFHGKSVRVRDAREAHLLLQAPWSTLTKAEKARVRRIRDALCGSETCTCGIVR